MMYGYGWNGMMGGGYGLGTILYIVVLVDLILLGVWLWKKVSKE